MRSNAKYDGDPLTASCFPLLPLCNRVRYDHLFREERDYGFEPNQPWDRHSLHGDGWLTHWNVRSQTPTSVTFAKRRMADTASPHAYATTIDAA